MLQRDGVTKRTQEERRMIAEQRLIESAAGLISQSGLAAVTLAKVGEQPGYSRGLATHRFGSKAGLIRRVTGAVTQQFNDMIAESSQSESGLSDLRAYVRAYIRVVSEHNVINQAQLMIIADSIANPAGAARDSVVDFDKVLRRYIRGFVRRAIADGEMSDSIDADSFAAIVVGLLRGVSFEAILDPGIDVARIGKEIERIIDGATVPSKRRKSRSKKPR